MEEWNDEAWREVEGREVLRRARKFYLGRRLDKPALVFVLLNAKLFHPEEEGEEPRRVRRREEHDDEEGRGTQHSYRGSHASGNKTSTHMASSLMRSALTAAAWTAFSSTRRCRAKKASSWLI